MPSSVPTSIARAAVFLGPGQPLALQELPLPELLPGEVLVRNRCCTVCGSDVHTWSGKRSGPAPSILGHEMVGVIQQLGPGSPAAALDGRPLSVGDRIVWAVVASCGNCEPCLAGRPQKCARAWKYGHQAFADRTPAGGLSPLSGGLATHCHLVAGTTIVRVPETLSDALAATASCAVATIAGAMRTAGDVRGKSVLITGAGMLGLIACAMSAEQGATGITAVDVSENRRSMAERMGASRAMAPEQIPSVKCDVLLECTGRASVTESAIGTLATGGRAVLVGAVYPDRPLQLDAQQIVRRMLRIEGLHNYTPADLEAGVCFLARHAGHQPLNELVSAMIPLGDSSLWQAASEAGDYPRVAVSTE